MAQIWAAKNRPQNEIGSFLAPASANYPCLRHLRAMAEISLQLVSLEGWGG